MNKIYGYCRCSTTEERQDINRQNRELYKLGVEDDKNIYQMFTNLIYRSLSCYTSEPKYNVDPVSFISKLQAALKNNLFENHIQKNADVISSVVLSPYKYKNSVSISCAVVRQFHEWFINATPASQELILTNISEKLSLIPMEEKEIELPF